MGKVKHSDIEGDCHEHDGSIPECRCYVPLPPDPPGTWKADPELVRGRFCENSGVSLPFERAIYYWREEAKRGDCRLV